MPFEEPKNWKQQAMGPLLAKSLASMIRHKFINEYGYSDAIPLAEFITNDLIELIKSVVKDRGTIKPGQLVWLAVEKAHGKKGYGTRLEDLPLKPVVLTFLGEEDASPFISGS